MLYVQKQAYGVWWPILKEKALNRIGDVIIYG